MKRIFLPLVMAAALFFSCSSDNEDDVNVDETASLVGTWNFTELDTANAASTAEITVANDLIEALLAQDCEILTFIFREDQTVDARAKDFEIDFEATELALECPANTETKTSIWSLEGDQLTFVNEDLSEETVTIELSGDTLIVPWEVVDETSLQGAKAIFKRL